MPHTCNHYRRQIKTFGKRKCFISPFLQSHVVFEILNLVFVNIQCFLQSEKSFWCQDSTVFLKTSIGTLSVKPDSLSQYRKNLSFKTKKMKREVNYIFLLNHWQKHALFFPFGSLWVIRLCFLVKKDRFFLCKDKIIFSFKSWVVHYQIPPLLLQFLKNSKNMWYRLFKKIIWYIINDFTFFLGMLNWFLLI